jgi:DNA-binding NarL/FixJ family response regulator
VNPVSPVTPPGTLPGGPIVLLVASGASHRARLATLLGAAVMPEQQRAPSLRLAESVAEAEYALRSLQPAISILVLDPPPAGTTVDEACRRLIDRFPDTASVVLLTTPTPPLVRRVCRSGARAVCRADLSGPELQRVLQAVRAGGRAIQPALSEFVSEQWGDPPEEEEGGAELSQREIEALRLLAQGYTSKQIAPLLRMTAKAVDMAIERTCRRLGATTRTQAVAIAIRRGLIT